MIPKNFHFIWLTGKDSHSFTINEYYSILTNFKVNDPANIYLYSNDEKLKDTYWVSRLKDDIPHNRFHFEYIESQYVRYYNGVEIPYVAHQSDILRLKILKEYGGVYIDCDCIAVNPMPCGWFFDRKVIWGKENCPELAFCNNVIAAPMNHPFISDCLDVYDNYDPDICKPNTEYWARYSVMKPVRIFNKHDHDYQRKINIREAKDFQPLYLNYADTLKLFFENHWDEVKDCYELHTWNTRNYGITRNFTEPYIMKADTTYCKAIRNGLGIK